ncbi:hypothetical protein ACFL7M_13035 [Thermodesulfobacteriota bacterium]
MPNKKVTGKVILTVASLLFFMFIGVQALFAETLKGRDYANMGELTTLTGTLVQIGDEWGLKVNNTTYEIHMGPSEYRDHKGFVLTNDETATVKGFIYNTDIAVATIETGGKSIVLRDENGQAAWSGTSTAQGEGR